VEASDIHDWFIRYRLVPLQAQLYFLSPVLHWLLLPIHSSVWLLCLSMRRCTGNWYTYINFQSLHDLVRACPNIPLIFCFCRLTNNHFALISGAYPPLVDTLLYYTQACPNIQLIFCFFLPSNFALISGAYPPLADPIIPRIHHWPGFRDLTRWSSSS